MADLAATPILGAVLLTLARFDLREGRLPDRLTLPLGALGLLLAAWRASGVPLAEIAGASGGFALFWVLGEVHFRLRGIEGLGQGDAKLLGAAGAWLGWRDLPFLVLAAALGALAFALLARRRPRDHPRELAFGPWLAAAFMGLWLGRLLGGGV